MYDVNVGNDSFIVISHEPYFDKFMKNVFVSQYERYVKDGVFTYSPRYVFDWHLEDYNNMLIKFDWVILSWGYLGFRDEHKEMIERFLTHMFSKKISIIPYNMKTAKGYISDQTNYDDVFSSYEDMKNFLLFPKSCIRSSNFC